MRRQKNRTEISKAVAAAAVSAAAVTADVVVVAADVSKMTLVPIVRTRFACWLMTLQTCQPRSTMCCYRRGGDKVNGGCGRWRAAGGGSP